MAIKTVNLVICDRCEKGTEGVKLPGDWSEISIKPGPRQKKAIDLCAECSQAFAYWMEATQDVIEVLKERETEMRKEKV